MVPCLTALIKHVWMVASCCIQASFQTRSDYGSVSVYKHLFPAPLIKHVWTVVPCCEQASIFTCVSNTFCGPWSVYIISQQPCVSNTIDLGFLFVYPPTHTKLRVASATDYDFKVNMSTSVHTSADGSESQATPCSCRMHQPASVVLNVTYPTSASVRGAYGSRIMRECMFDVGSTNYVFE